MATTATYRAIARDMLTRLHEERPANVDRWVRLFLERLGRQHRARIEIQLGLLLRAGDWR
jgi:hypothetical protein